MAESDDSLMDEVQPGSSALKAGGGISVPRPGDPICVR